MNDNPEQDEGIKTLNQLLGETDMPEVQRGTDGRKYYMIYITVQDWPVQKKKCVHVDCELAQSVFEDYVLHWANLTGLEVQKKYGMTGKTWQAFKSCMNLVKHSLPIPHDRLKFLTEADMADEFEEIIERGVDTHVGKILDKAGEKKRNAMLNDFAMKLAVQDSWTQDIVQEFDRAGMPSIPPRTFRSQAKTVESVSVILTDAHFWNRETYETAKRLGRVIDHLIEQPVDRINVLMLGDDLEDATQMWAHPDTKLSMHPDFRQPHKLILYVSALYAEELNRLKANHDVDVKAVRWNHDRVTESRDDDQFRLAGWMMHQLLQRQLDSKIGFEDSDETMLVTMISWIEHFLFHWDVKGLAKMKPDEIVSRFGKFRTQGEKVILSWHIHRLQHERSGRINRISAGALTAPWVHEIREWYVTKDTEPTITLLHYKGGKVDIEHKQI